jgi:hypothetical protein
MHDRQFSRAGIAKQMRNALIFEEREEGRTASDAVQRTHGLSLL